MSKLAVPKAKSKKKDTKTSPGFKSILSKKQTGGVKVYIDGLDVTPEPLLPLVNEGAKAKSGEDGGEGDTASVTSKTLHSQSASRFSSALHKQTIAAESVFRQSGISTSFVEDVVIEPEKKGSAVSVHGEDSFEDIDMPPGEGPPETLKQVTLILKETNTIFLLELPSKTVEKNTELASEIEEQNARYEYLTLGKGRNRKMVNAEVQTSARLYKSRFTEAELVKRKNIHSFASNWEMYDTFQEVQAANLAMKEYEENISLPENSASVDSLSAPFEEREMIKLIKSDKFLEAVCIIERLLANNNFNEMQKCFRGFLQPDPFREDIEYNYKLNLLWTFANNETLGFCVTAMSWNDANPDIVAISYGKFYYTEDTTGMVMLWNMKNPVQPERKYCFEQPVTCINFSKQNPNLLGIGFYNGTLKLLDVSLRTQKVFGLSVKETPSFEPLWQLIWFKGSSYYQNNEQVITTCQDGRIGYYKRQDTLELVYTQIMRIARPEGKLKGIQSLRPCHVPGVPVSRYASALVIQQQPTDLNIYYVGTSEGTVHKCSRNYYHQHFDLFLAHDGPVYELKFSPFCNKIFLTCGDDWHVRIWAEGIYEPLFELTKTMQSVQGADWSPTHSTVIANICGSDIYLWDLQRKTYYPQSITANPASCRNTVVQFIKSGQCLVVGDIDGNVHVFSVEDMPFPAFFQDDLLANSIFRGLITRPDIINKLKKLGKLNVTETQS